MESKTEMRFFFLPDFEKEEKYFDIINERIAKHTQQRAGEFSFENEL